MDDDVLNPADLGQDPASASTWFFGWMRQFFGLARRLLASTSSWPTIRLRHFLASAEGFSGSAEGFSGSAEGFSWSGGSYRLTLIGTGGFVFSSLADFAELDLGTFQRANWRFFARKVAEGGLASAI